jgi:hypothetical protein
MTQDDKCIYCGKEGEKKKHILVDKRYYMSVCHSHGDWPGSVIEVSEEEFLSGMIIDE